MGKFLQGLVRFQKGEFLQARAFFEQCHGLDDGSHRKAFARITAEDPYAALLSFLALTLAYLGYFDRAHACAEKALWTAGKLEHLYSLVVVSIYASWVNSIAGSPHEALRYATDAVNLSNEHGFPYWSAWGMVHCGWSMTALGKAQEGLGSLTNGLSVVYSTGATISTSWTLMLLAEAYTRLTQPDEALNRLLEAEQFITTTNERFHEAELYRLRGDLLNANGDPLSAELNYHRALTIANQQSAKTFELRAATSLARLSCDQGKRTEVRDLLAPIYNWFTEGHDTPVLKKAKSLLDLLK